MLSSVLKDIFSRAPGTRHGDAKVGGDGAIACERWFNELLGRMFKLMHHFEQDNFDADRYRNEPENAFYHEQHAAYFALLLKHVSQFFDARGLLEDEASRELFDQLILFRVMGHHHVRLPFNTASNRAHIVTAGSWRVEDTEDVGAFGPLSIFVVPGNGHDIRVKGWKENVAWTFLYRQYYFDRAGMKIQPAPGDHVIDAGGCFGDTALGFADVVGDRGHVYVFDPLPRHCAIMRQALQMNPILAPRITLFATGLSDRTNEVAPLPEDGRIDPGARIVPATMPTSTIDETVARHKVPQVDFIKMDIEGSELGALRGAESTIRSCRPKLAISLYHRPEDFFSIPFWIDSLGVGYRMYLEHYSIHQEETVLFATV